MSERCIAVERRTISLARLFEKVQKAINDGGFEPQQVPDKIWTPILMSASVEEDDFLQEQWAALLTNAANPITAGNFRESFPEILRNLSKAEAVFLSAIYDSVCQGIDAYPPEINPRILTADGIGERDALLIMYVEAGLTSNVFVDLITYAGMAKPRVADDLLAFDVSLDTLKRLQLLSTRLELKGLDGSRQVKEHYFMTALGLVFVRTCRPPQQRH